MVAETIFSTMTRIAQQTGAINLGQGFPNEQGPASMLARAQEEIASGNNQYAPGRGFEVLRQAVAADRGGFYTPDEVLITVGATEGLAATILALTSPGDEVILIEPHYDAYAAVIAMAGATMIPVPMTPDFRPDIAAVAAAVGPRTRAILINTPHNPTGIMFTREETEAVAEIARRHNIFVISDEVYEKFPFDGRQHIPIATLPGMKERTITISSAAKMLRCTGWKTGWVMATPELIDAIVEVKQYLTFVGASPFQPAIAQALMEEQAWIGQAAASMQKRRDLLRRALEAAGYPTYGAEGGYFILAECDVDAMVDKGIVGIPVSAFVSSGTTRFDNLVRFALCRSDEDIAKAARILAPQLLN
ncbi:MAG: aminotransferase class I/II-fold pyridoxal phosphate-dependent enzyme [Corynebacterium sp.]|nr:aminotransferase class I/II-fold pyridoxal phosphate-dependent enzyme [Corynebacterium sp.]